MMTGVRGWHAEFRSGQRQACRGCGWRVATCQCRAAAQRGGCRAVTRLHAERVRGRGDVRAPDLSGDRSTATSRRRQREGVGDRVQPRLSAVEVLGPYDARPPTWRSGGRGPEGRVAGNVPALDQLRIEPAPLRVRARARRSARRPGRRRFPPSAPGQRSGPTSGIACHAGRPAPRRRSSARRARESRRRSRWRPSMRARYAPRSQRAWISAGVDVPTA